MTIWIKTPNLKYNIWSVLVLLSCNIPEMSWTPQQLQVYWACCRLQPPHSIFWENIDVTFIFCFLWNPSWWQGYSGPITVPLCTTRGWMNIVSGFLCLVSAELGTNDGRPPAALRWKSSGSKGWPMELCVKAHFCQKSLGFSFYNQQYGPATVEPCRMECTTDNTGWRPNLK